MKAKASALAILAATALAAQTAVTVSGRITDASNGVPIVGAEVILFSGEVPTPTRQVTDSAGNYRIDGVTPGAASLRVDARGFLDSIPAKIQLTADNAAQNVALTPVSSIAGRIRTEDGSAIPASISLVLYREDYADGIRHWATGINTSPVQNDGAFRIDNLPAGHYILSASPPMGGFSMFVVARMSGAMGTTPTSTAPDENYIQTYYPGTTDFNAAVPITLLEGESITADFSIAKHHLYRISGELAPGHTPLEGAVIVSSPGDGIMQRSYAGSSSASGKFSVGGLPPGNYVLESISHSAMQSNASISTVQIRLSLPFTITDHDIEDLHPSPALPVASIPVQGVFKMANGIPLPASLSVRYGYPKPGLPTDTIPAAPTGEFYLEGAGSDYSVRPIVPPTYAVSEIRYAGGNYLNSFIPFNADATDQSLTIVLTDQPASVSGSLIDGQQKPIAARVILAPDPLPPNFDFHALRVAATNSDGSFTLNSLTAGRYKAAVLTGDNRKRDHDLAILNDKFATADAFELTAGQNLTITPKP